MVGNFKEYMNESEKTITLKAIITGWKKVGIECRVWEEANKDGVTFLVAKDTVEPYQGGDRFVDDKVEKYFEKLQNSYSNIKIGDPYDLEYIGFEPSQVLKNYTAIAVMPDKDFYINKLKKLSLEELKTITNNL